MITHIHAVTIVVSDQDKAIDFYVNVLGWEKTDGCADGPMHALGHRGAEGRGDEHRALAPSWYTQKPSLEMGINTGIAFIADDMKATYAELTKRGVKFKGEPEMMPWGKLGAGFVDPDRNEFFMAENLSDNESH